MLQTTTNKANLYFIYNPRHGYMDAGSGWTTEKAGAKMHFFEEASAIAEWEELIVFATAVEAPEAAKLVQPKPEQDAKLARTHYAPQNVLRPIRFPVSAEKRVEWESSLENLLRLEETPSRRARKKSLLRMIAWDDEAIFEGKTRSKEIPPNHHWCPTCQKAVIASVDHLRKDDTVDHDQTDEPVRGRKRCSICSSRVTEVVCE